MISMIEARRYVANIDNVKTSRIKDVITILEDLDRHNQLTQPQLWLLPKLKEVYSQRTDK